MCSGVSVLIGGYQKDSRIGMNILRKGDMALTNAHGEMVFSFRIPPAETHIDFVKEAKTT